MVFIFLQVDAYECDSARAVERLPGHKHTSEVALLWFEVRASLLALSALTASQPARDVYLPPPTPPHLFRLVCAGLASAPGV